MAKPKPDIPSSDDFVYENLEESDHRIRQIHEHRSSELTVGHEIRIAQVQALLAIGGALRKLYEDGLH